MAKPQGISIKRQERAKRKVTGNTKGETNRKCVAQDSEIVGRWLWGEDKIRIFYLHITRGWKTRLLGPTRIPSIHSYRQA